MDDMEIRKTLQTIAGKFWTEVQGKNDNIIDIDLNFNGGMTKEEIQVALNKISKVDEKLIQKNLDIVINTNLHEAQEDSKL